MADQDLVTVASFAAGGWGGAFAMPASAALSIGEAGCGWVCAKKEGNAPLPLSMTRN